VLTVLTLTVLLACVTCAALVTILLTDLCCHHDGRYVEAVDGRSPSQLRTDGYSAKLLRNSGWALPELKKGGYPVKELKDKCGYNSDELKAVRGLTRLDSTWLDLVIHSLRAKDTLRRCDAAPYSDCALVTLRHRRVVRCSHALCRAVMWCVRQVGFTAKALREGGFSSKQLSASGFSLRELREGGFVWKDLVRARDEGSHHTDRAPCNPLPVASAVRSAIADVAECVCAAAEHGRSSSCMRRTPSWRSAATSASTRRTCSSSSTTQSATCPRTTDELRERHLVLWTELSRPKYNCRSRAVHGECRDATREGAERVTWNCEAIAAPDAERAC
jgi:hypothetical protein